MAKLSELLKPNQTLPYSRLALLIVLGAGLVWAYWPVLAEIQQRWNMPEYSHGYFVPVFALGLLWFRRELLKASTSAAATWCGLAVFLVGLGLYLAGGLFFFGSLAAFSLLFVLAGLCLLQGGWPAFRWAWPAIGFLVFMIPLPQNLESRLSGPLQSLATRSSTYALQTLGFPAFNEGNLIRINEAQLSVVQACNGLSMLFVLLALAVLIALVLERPLWEKLLVALSAIPIALAANVVRITVTGMLYELATSEIAEWVFHDVAGWFMMPFALGLIWLECQFLARVLLEVEPAQPVPLDLAAADLAPASTEVESKPKVEAGVSGRA